MENFFKEIKENITIQQIFFGLVVLVFFSVLFLNGHFRNNFASIFGDPVSIPTTSLTANGSHNITVGVGQNITYVWSSANADSYISSYTVDSPSCGQPGTGLFPWQANTQSGTISGVTANCQAGHVYTITYKVTQTSTGLSAQDTVVVTVSERTYRAFFDQNNLEPECKKVPLEPSQTLIGIRCSYNSPYSDFIYTKPSGDIYSQKVLYSNGEPSTISLFGGKNTFNLGFPLGTQITQWWQQWNNPQTTSGVRGNLAVLQSNAYDQICRDTSNRNQNTCQFPFPDLQNSRRMALGLACPPGNVLDSTILFSNGTIAAQRLGIMTYMQLGFPLGVQITQWWQQWNDPNVSLDTKNNLKILLAMAYDQTARCGGANQSVFPEYSRRGVDYDSGAPQNLIDNGLFDSWSRGTIFTSAISQGVYTADSWYEGPGHDAQIKVTREDFPIGQTEVPGNPKYFMRTQWIKPATSGETALSPRETWVEHYSPKLGNVAAVSDEVVVLTFYIRSDTPVKMIPILWQSFGGTEVPVPIIIYDGELILAQNNWQKVVRRFRLPGVKGFQVSWSSYVGVGIDNENNIGFSGTVDLANFSLIRE